MESVPESLWPLVVYAALVGFVVVAMLVLSHFLGERHRRRGQGAHEPFESGITPVGYGRFRMSAHYYIVAMFFVLFDLEVVFILAWAIAYEPAGWAGYIAVLVFIGILVAGLAYEWRSGALDWAPKGRRPGQTLTRGQD